MRERNFADFGCFYAQALSPHKHSKLVKLVGNRPLVNYSLNDKMFEGLWDTGSMISLISKTWLDFKFPKQTVYPIDSLLVRRRVNLASRQLIILKSISRE